MEKKRKSYRKIKNQQKFILILITCVLIIAAIFLGSKLAKKRVCLLYTSGKIKDCSFLESDISDELLNSFKENELPLINTKLEDEMRQEILSTRSSGDSIGGTIELSLIHI